MNEDIARRKIEHVAVALRHDLAAPQPASWADIQLIHRALPEVDRDEVDTTVSWLGKPLGAPIFISSLTGGHADVTQINVRLARAAERFGLAMGVGSQRAALRDSTLAETYSVLRDLAPHAFRIANIGAPQLIAQPHKTPYTVEDARAAIAMVGADALAVHLNYLQEAAQPEGDPRARGVLAALTRLTAALAEGGLSAAGRQPGVPVIAKETGAGISAGQALALRAAGVSAIDVGGAGGSSMAAMEAVRAQERGDTRTQRVGELFRDWGIATPISVVEAGRAGLPLIATGGIRSGLDAARALALGATLVGVGFPLLRAASESDEAVTSFLEDFLLELRVAMHLTGAATVADLHRVPVVTTGATRAWLELRGFGPDLATLAQRDLV